MKFNRIWLGIMRRRFARWLQSLLAPSPSTQAPTVPEYKGWTATQQRLEEESYLASPHAVWLKPDRFETRLWMEGVWVKPNALPETNASTTLTYWGNAAMTGCQSAANQRSLLAQMQMYNQASALQQHTGYNSGPLFGNLLGPLL